MATDSKTKKKAAGKRGKSTDATVAPKSLQERFYLTLAQLGDPADEYKVHRRLAMAQLRAITAKMDASVQVTARRFGIHVTDLNILILLLRTESPQMVRAADLQHALGFTAGGVTRRLDSMAARDLVCRLPDPDDGRSWQVRLTHKGQALAEQLFESPIRNSSHIADRLSLDDWVRLEELLTVINEAMD